MNINQVNSREQLEQCLAIRREVFVVEQEVPEQLETDEFDRFPGDCVHLLAMNGDKPAGTARWIPYDQASGTVKFQRLAVKKEYRGTGLGAKLINALEQSAAEAGAKTAILNGQQHLEGFYKKLGYETVSSEPFLDAGIWHLQMKKPLRA